MATACSHNGRELQGKAGLQEHVDDAFLLLNPSCKSSPSPVPCSLTPQNRDDPRWGRHPLGTGSGHARTVQQSPASWHHTEPLLHPWVHKGKPGARMTGTSKPARASGVLWSHNQPEGCSSSSHCTAQCRSTKKSFCQAAVLSGSSDQGCRALWKGRDTDNDVTASPPCAHATAHASIWATAEPLASPYSCRTTCKVHPRGPCYFQETRRCLCDLVVPTDQETGFIPMASGERPANPPAPSTSGPTASSSVSCSAFQHLPRTQGADA